MTGGPQLALAIYLGVLRDLPRADLVVLPAPQPAGAGAPSLAEARV